jgi:hypothetical protein
VIGVELLNNEHDDVSSLIDGMRRIQSDFIFKFGVNDIWSNSKIYEVIQAQTLGHKLIPGHSGSLDAADSENREYEYKHYKESSSNHSWTFNDFSKSTISKLENKVHEVIFAHIEDTGPRPVMDWAFRVPGETVATYLKEYTPRISNNRKMINVSPSQIERRLGFNREYFQPAHKGKPYGEQLETIFRVSDALENALGVSSVLTSNKLWEVIVSLPLGHTVNSEQGGRAGAHDAIDEFLNVYEYKVSSSRSWNFQDISEAVLIKYLDCKKIVLAVVDKPNFRVNEIWLADPTRTVRRLREKLEEKKSRFAAANKDVRRLQVSISKSDLIPIGAEPWKGPL